MSDWLLHEARKDEQSIAADWEAVGRTLIDGVRVREARCVGKRNGSVTELYRDDWFPGADGVGQVFVVRLAIAAVSAWHAHGRTIDRLTVIAGAAALVLYDARRDSPTFGRVKEFLLPERRPTVIVIPPRVWHGVANTGDEPCLLYKFEPGRPRAV
jgi:dTDP-4-dehydrorhamnose 3,5-epimerase